MLSVSPHIARIVLIMVAGAASLFLGNANGQGEITQPSLAARAVLPTDTFATGPSTGAQIDPAQSNGRQVPFGSHPVQGVSGILHTCTVSDRERDDLRTDPHRRRFRPRVLPAHGRRYLLVRG